MVANTDRVPETNDSFVNDSFLQVAGYKREALGHGEARSPVLTTSEQAAAGRKPAIAANGGCGHGTFRWGDGA
jgi:hypothetical protein